MEWETFYEEWYVDIDGLRDEGAEGLTPETPFELDWAKHRSSATSFAQLIRDPREYAYRVLPSDIDYSEHTVLDTDLNMGGASPGPNIGTVTAESPDTFKRLEDFLADKGYDEFSIEEALDFVLECYKGFH